MTGKELFDEEVNVISHLLRDYTFLRRQEGKVLIAEWEGKDEVLRLIYKPKH